MKTELITNVSHDLKTPLTAIITYVNLLKDEKDEEKRKDYIDILERKSMRLKVLIEDLFEISKASSQNVNLNLMNVDIVNLFKQVKFELEDKFEEKGLEFRTTFPEEKVILCLDSQKLLGAVILFIIHKLSVSRSGKWCSLCGRLLRRQFFYHLFRSFSLLCVFICLCKSGHTGRTHQYC